MRRARLLTILAITFFGITAVAQPARVFEQSQWALYTLLGQTLDPAQKAAPEMYTRGHRAVIEILVEDHLNGTGFIVSPGGYALTAGHVVQTPGQRIEARTVHGRVNATVVALDLGHDLGLIKLDKPPHGAWPMLTLAERAPPVATEIYLLGTPIYRHHVLFKGMIARAVPTFEYLPDEQRYVRIIHVSGMSPPGTSGGPWMLRNGEVVGLQTGLMHSRGTHVGVAYITPLDAMRALIRRGEDAKTASIGAAIEEIWEQPDHFLKQFPKRTEGVVVSRLVSGGPGVAAGLRADDVITHVDGRRTALRDDLLAYVRARNPGETVTLSVLHAGEQPRRVKVKLDQLERRR